MYIYDTISVMAYVSFYLSKYPDMSQKNTTLHDTYRPVNRFANADEAQIKIKGVRHIFTILYTSIWL